MGLSHEGRVEKWGVASRCLLLHKSRYRRYQRGYYYMPSPAGKGDREAVDEVWNSKDTAEAKSMVVFDLPKTFFHFAVRQNFTPQVFHLPTAAYFTRRRRISLCNCPGSCALGDREAVDEENILWQL